MKLLVCIAALIALSGCAAGSLREIRETNAGVIRADVDEGYQALYRRSLDHFRGCWSGGWIGSQYLLESDLYTDIERGDISFSLSGVFGKQTYMLVEITGAEKPPEHSDVTIYYYFNTWETSAQRAAAFVRGEDDAC